MKYKCIRGVVSSAGALVVGSVVALPENEAAQLMAAGKIVPHHEEAVIENRVPAVEHRDPAPRRGRKPKHVA